MEFVRNALDRRVPTEVNGNPARAYRCAFDPGYGQAWAGRPGRARMRHGESKVTTLDEVVDLIGDGDWISYPHYYRLGDRCLRLVVEKLRDRGRRGIKILGNAFFDNCVPWLPEAVMDGTIGGFMGNCYRGMGAHLTTGDFLPWVNTGFGHGCRVRKFHTGEVRVKMAFGPVPIADRWGNSNGCMGNPRHWVGPLGLFLADTKWAEHACLLAGEISDRYLFPRSVSMADVDFVVPVDDPGDSAGIGSGTIDLEKIRSNPFNARIADRILAVMEASGVIRDGFNFQVGSGAGLVVLEGIRRKLGEKRIRAGFAIGGCTSLHIDMLHDGLIGDLLHGQCFEPSKKVIESMLRDPNHHEITAQEYDDASSKENAVNMLDVSVLSALETDLRFNVNSVCANGRFIGGIGGAQGVAAGSKLTIIFLPLATGKRDDGLGFPRVVDEVFTVSIPGEVIDVIVTEDYISINPASRSPSVGDLRRNAAAAGLEVVGIEELRDRSREAALRFGAIPPRIELTDTPVQVVEWRDGTLLDTVFLPAE